MIKKFRLCLHCSLESLDELSLEVRLDFHAIRRHLLQPVTPLSQTSAELTDGWERSEHSTPLSQSEENSHTVTGWSSEEKRKRGKWVERSRTTYPHHSKWWTWTSLLLITTRSRQVLFPCLVPWAHLQFSRSHLVDFLALSSGLNLCNCPAGAVTDR